MAEQITLANPTPPVVPGSTRFVVGQITLDRGVVFDAALRRAAIDPNRASITALLVGEGGEQKSVTLYQGQAATNAIIALNKTDLRAQTLAQRILVRAQAVAAELAGQLGGVVD